MNILHKEGHNITIWVYSDDGLPLYPIIVQSDTVTDVSAQHSVQADASTTEALIAEIVVEVESMMYAGNGDMSDLRRFLRERLRR